MFSTSPLDWGLLLLYFGFLVAMWLRARRRVDDATEYLLAGRRVTLPALVASLVATWYGGILGVGEYSYRYGISNWLVFGAPYYLSALLFALLFAARARRAAFTTIPDLLDRHYGRGPALMGAVAVFVTSAPAAYVLMLGTLFAAMFGLPLVPCVIAATVFSVFYVAKGGLRNAVLADQVYFVLMYGGFALLVGFLISKHGALPWQPGAMPATHFTWDGGRPFAAIVVWYFIALSALVDPAFWQIANAAKDPKTARRAVLVSIGFWTLFDAMTTVSGLYARALLPTLGDPVFAFPELARATLPPLALGIFFLGMIATVMSTIDSYAFIAATTLGRDLLWRLRREPDESRVPAYTRLGLWAAGGFAVIVALANPSVVSLWHDLGSITTPTLLLPVGVALLGRGRLSAAPTLAAMAIAFAVSLVWVLAKDPAPPGGSVGYPFGIEPIYAGLGVSLAVYALGWSFGWRGDRLPRAAELT
jgi:SSS family solute:Na+ symporter